LSLPYLEKLGPNISKLEQNTLWLKKYSMIRLCKRDSTLEKHISPLAEITTLFNDWLRGLNKEKG
jgi:hypothetical protein